MYFCLFKYELKTYQYQKNYLQNIFEYDRAFVHPLPLVEDRILNDP